MQEMKRLTALLMAVAMTVSMAGCSININVGGDASSDSDTADSTASAAETTDNETVDAAEQEEETVEPEETEEQADAVDTSSSEAGEVELSDSLYDYTFTLDGVVYQLPFAYTELTDNGWVTNSDEDTSISPNDYEMIYMYKGNSATDASKITVYVINMSGNAKELKDCKVGGIEVTAQDLTDISLFSVAKGITLEASAEDITEAFGEGDFSSVKDNYTYTVYDGEDYQCETTFTIYTDGTNDYNTIKIDHRVADEDDVTEISEEVPAYLSDYVAPTELGSDVTSCVFELEGKLYQLPCPVSEFLDDGWTFDDRPDSVVGDGTVDVYMTKGSNRGDLEHILLKIGNYEDYQTTPENCAVYQVTVDSKNGYSMTMPGGIDFTSDADAVYDAYGKILSYESDDGYDKYSYNDNSDDAYISIFIMVKLDDDSPCEFRIINENWAY